MERVQPALPSLLGVPVPVQLRRVGNRWMLELAPDGETLVFSAIQVVAADCAFRFHRACAQWLAGEWTTALRSLPAHHTSSTGSPAGPPDESMRLPAELRSILETFTQHMEGELAQLRDRHLARLYQTATSAGGLTPEELDADRALCELLEVNPENLPVERLEELRQLWA